MDAVRLTSCDGCSVEFTYCLAVVDADRIVFSVLCLGGMGLVLGLDDGFDRSITNALSSGLIGS